MAVRAARLYPLYLLGLGLGFLFAVTQHSVGTGHPSLARTSASLALGLVGLPSPASLQGGDTHLFPLNLALWSLFFEVIANVGHAVLLRRRSTAALVAVVAAAGAGLVMLAAATGGLDVGARTATIGGGLLRVTFGYGMGVLLFRAWKRQAVRWSVPPLMPVLLLLAVLDAPLWGWGIDAFAVIAVLPCVLLLSACAPVGWRSIGVCNLLGTTSYAVYVLHLPLIWAIAATVKHLHLALPDAAFKPVLLVGMFAVAWGVDRTYDAWARTRLKRLLFSSHADRHGARV